MRSQFSHLRPFCSAINRASGLPFRIRVPLAKLKEKKNEAPQAFRPPALGDGEQLETNAAGPDYLRLALTSRVYDLVEETPLQHARALSHATRACVHLKREDLHPSFSSYLRGAVNKLASLKAQGATHVVAVSVGSRGHAVAYAASELGLRATVVMPVATPSPRRAAIERFGASVVVHGSSLAEAADFARGVAAGAGTTVHVQTLLTPPHDDPLVIAGQATAGYELLRQHGTEMAKKHSPASQLPPQLDAVFVPVGGGSLIAGVAIATKQLMCAASRHCRRATRRAPPAVPHSLTAPARVRRGRPNTKVIGVEPAAVDTLRRSLGIGKPVELPDDADPSKMMRIDGLYVPRLGDEVFRICNELVDDVVTVTPGEIGAAVRDCFEDTRSVLEPAGALSIAGLKKWVEARPINPATGQKGNYIAVCSDAANIELVRRA